MIFHPKDTRQTVSSASIIDNFALRFNYFLNFNLEKSRKYKVTLPESGKTLPAVITSIINSIVNRQKYQIKAMQTHYQIRAFEAQVDWRMVVGLGSGHVQETNMTLHHIYGFPYIPGSAIKGVFHHWADSQISTDEITKIFGSTEQKGNVIFMDAFPSGDVEFVMDIMNSHYPDYYGNGGHYPTDCQNPNPVNFLTVEKAAFRFYFLSKQSDCLEKVAGWLKDILEMKGLGAKTAVCYGYFKEIKEITNTLQN